MPFLKHTIEELQTEAAKRGGKCLTEKYISYKSKLKFQCKYNHIWETTAGHIFRKQWCPKCARVTKLTIAEMKELANNRHGICLSDVYINSRTKLKWQCASKHVWEAIPDVVKNRGAWCPYCRCSVSEEICRQYFEHIFDKKFLSVRPSWLVSKNNFLMELDGYCEELGIAFEHNGMHHYDIDHPFNDGYVFERDLLKNQLCYDNGVILINIPALFIKLKIDDLYSFIINECKIYKLKIINNSIPVIDKNKIHTYSIQKYIDIAVSKGGKLIIDSYLNSITKCNWQCSLGHVWTTIPNSIKNGSWCPQCSRIKHNKNRNKENGRFNSFIKTSL